MPDKRLRPVVDHLDRLAGPLGQKREMYVKRNVLASPKCTTQAHRVTANGVFWNTKTGDDLLLVDVDPLRGDMEVNGSHPIGDGDTGLGPEWCLILGRCLVVTLDNHLTRCGRIPPPNLHLSKDFALGLGCFGIDRGRKLLPINNNRLHGLSSRLRVLRGNHCHRLSPKLRHFVTEHRLVLMLLTKGAKTGHVLLGEHGVNTGHRQRWRRVDADQTSVGVWAAKCRSPKHPVSEQI